MDPVSDDLKPPLTTTTSIWPAAMIMIIAVVMLAVFLGINIVADQGVTKTKTTAVPVVVGGLATDAHSTLLQNCHQPGNPPANIASAMIVPVDTSSTGPAQIPDEGAGEFDCYRPLSTTATPAAIISYYANHLEALGWGLFSKGTSTGTPQDLFMKAGSDGFDWVLGVTVTSTTSAATQWKYTIYQDSDMS